MFNKVVEVNKIVGGLAKANNMSPEEYASVLREALVNLHDDEKATPNMAAFKALFSNLKLVNRCRFLLSLISNINNNTLDWNVLGNLILSDLDEYDYNANLPEIITKKSHITNLLNDIEMALIGKAPFRKYVCQDCNKVVYLTIGEVEFYKTTKNKKGQPYKLPKLCKECKEKRKETKKFAKKVYEAESEALKVGVADGHAIEKGNSSEVGKYNRKVSTSTKSDNSQHNPSFKRCDKPITVSEASNTASEHNISVVNDFINTTVKEAIKESDKKMAKELGIEFECYPIDNPEIDKIANNLKKSFKKQEEKHVSRKTKLHNGEEIPAMEGNTAILDAMRKAGLQ